MKINQDDLNQSAKVLRALAHPLRMQILQYISQHPATTVGPIYRNMKLEQSVVSQHLHILRKAGLVTDERESKFIHYSVNESRVKRINNSIRAFMAEEVTEDIAVTA